jgi:sugar lactone lactonase YvrE
MINRPRSVSRALVLAGAVAVTALAIGVSAAADGPSESAKKVTAATTWTTVLKTTLGIEGLTGDGAGNLYVAARGGGAACPVWRVSSTGGANQTPVTVGTVPAPCGPAGLTFDAAGRLYVTGAGAAGDQIAVLTPDAAAPPVATIFATGMPGANGLAFDRHGNLYASDGGTAQGRVFRVGPQGGAATELFRVPPMANSVGVGRQNASLQPPLAPAPQNIVANGLALTQDGALLIADTARGALWRVEFDEAGNVLSPVGCDTTFTANTLCFENLFVQHPFLEGADGIALDRAGNVWADANERNAVVVVDRQGRVSEFFRNPVAAASLRNQGPLEFPTSPFLSDRTLCTTSSDGNRRDNSPNSGGEVGPGTGFAGKISCADERLQVPGLPLPVG